jgi:hypothetical protein
MRMQRLFWTGLSAIVLVVLISCFEGLHAQETAPNVKINTVSDYQGVETTITHNPTNPLNLVAGAILLPPGIAQNIVFYSTDGGAHWAEQLLTLTAGQKTFERSGDPVLAADADGNFYYAALMFDPGILQRPFQCGPQGRCDHGIFVFRSTDSGVHWSNPVPVIQRIGGPITIINDKPWIAVDTSSRSFKNNIYVCFQRVGTTTGNSQGIWFSRSTDRGATFSVPFRVSGNIPTEGCSVAVGPEGEVYVAWLLKMNTRRIMIDKSTDGGMNFGTDVRVSNVTLIPDPLPTSSTSGIKNTKSYPSIDIDRSNGPDRGRVYVVWADNRTGDADILLKSSLTGAAGTWSTGPIRVNNDPRRNGVDQFFSTVRVDAQTGEVLVSFYQRQNGPNNTSLLDIFLARSSDGGKSFPISERVTDTSFNPNFAEQFVFLGDYQDMTVVDGVAHPIWIDTRKERLDIYTAAVAPTVQYLSFEQVAGEIRNPGIPGDGIIISSLPFAGFIVSPPFSLEKVTNGITFSAFFRDTQPGIDVTDIRLDLRLTGQPPVPPCGFYNAVRASSPPVLTPPVNGVQGIAVSFTQADLDAVVHPPQPAPECAHLTINDYSVQNVLFFKGEGFGVIPDLDAFAVGLGVNVFP